MKGKPLTDEEILHIKPLKECHKCKRFLPKSEFHKDRTMSDGLCSKCKECVKESNKQYRNTHKEYWRDYNKRYYKRTKEELANKLGKKCKICGRTPKENRKLFLAHEIYGRPHSQSRNYIMKHLEDFVVLCVPCHRCVHFCMKYLGLSWNQIWEFVKRADMKPTKKEEIPNDRQKES